MNQKETNEQMRNKRIGEQNYNNQGELMTIIDYRGAFDITVRFEKTKKTKDCRYSNFKRGKVKDNFLPVVTGVGFLGDIDKVDPKDREKGGAYRIWTDMIARCYDKVRYPKYKTYNDCFVCDEWHCYANFKKWYDENFYKIDDEQMCIDKDIIIKGNKVYSPDTCVFVPQRINKLFVNNKACRGEYPLGVCLISGHQGLFAARMKVNNKDSKSTYHHTPEEAFYSYKKMKEQRIKDIANEYKSRIPQKLYDALYAYEIEITD